MLFGDPAEFAIEVLVESTLPVPTGQWGRMCLHFAGVRFGDFEIPCCRLSEAFSHLDCFARTQSLLWDPAFDGKTPEQIHDLVRSALYGVDDRPLAAPGRDSRHFARFDFLTNWGEQFDGYESVIVSPDPESVMVLHRPGAGSASRWRLPGDFVVAKCLRSVAIDVSRRSVAWYELECERLR